MTNTQMLLYLSGQSACANIEKTEAWSVEWNKLLGEIASITSQMDISQIDDRVADFILNIMYTLYDTNRPYVEQVQENRERFRNDYWRFL